MLTRKKWDSGYHVPHSVFVLALLELESCSHLNIESIGSSHDGFSWVSSSNLFQLHVGDVVGRFDLSQQKLENHGKSTNLSNSRALTVNCSLPYALMPNFPSLYLHLDAWISPDWARAGFFIGSGFCFFLAGSFFSSCSSSSSASWSSSWSWSASAPSCLLIALLFDGFFLTPPLALGVAFALDFAAAFCFALPLATAFGFGFSTGSAGPADAEGAGQASSSDSSVTASAGISFGVVVSVDWPGSTDGGNNSRHPTAGNKRNIWSLNVQTIGTRPWSRCKTDKG